MLPLTGKPAEAEDELRRTSRAIEQKLADDNPAVTSFRNNLAVNRLWLGRAAVTDRQAGGGGGRAPAQAREIFQKLADDNPAPRLSPIAWRSSTATSAD